MSAHISGHDEGNDPLTETLVLIVSKATDNVTSGYVHYFEGCRAVVVLEWGLVVVPKKHIQARIASRNFTVFFKLL